MPRFHRGERGSDIRLFTAIPLPQEVASEVAKATADLTGVRRIAQGNLHITIEFLGEVEEDEHAQLMAELARAASRHRAFTLEISGGGAFPSPAAPRVLWAGVHGDVDELTELVHDVRLETKSHGINETLPYKPHVSVARARRPAEGRHAALQVMKFGSFGSFEVGSFVLYSSELTPNGPIYAVQRKFLLG